MTTYLCHGFRWHRRSIQYFVVIQDVEEAASGWIVAPRSPAALLDQFYELFDFLPPSTDPARYPSPEPHSAHNDLPASNGHAHSPTHPYKWKEEREEQIDSENSENGNGSRQNRSLVHSKSLGQLATTNEHDSIPVLSSPEPAESEDIVPFNEWSPVKFLEEFDPSDLTTVSGPWAYVADYVVRINTSVSITEEINRYETQMKTEPYKAMSGASDDAGRRLNTFGHKKAGWFEKLRDKLQKNESIQWYIVVCDDEERPGTKLAERKKAKEGEQNRSPRGLVENGFEFRLPELLAPDRVPELQPRRRRVEEKTTTTTQQNAPPLPNNAQSSIPLPPTPLRVDHKTAMGNGMKHQRSKSTGMLRRMFLRRRPDDLT